MSHCTTFELSFRDKRLVFRALRNLGLQPHNQVWKRFRSEIHKQFGVQGEDLGKLLTGTDGIVHIIFIETA
ncbi:MAG: hypothetical protein K0Q59_4363, partial [Paenibacillus sp.]|nr:hypothetical protein [Paenibacillus sp.]